jgi:uncharacterized protein DUF2690
MKVMRIHRHLAGITGAVTLAAAGLLATAGQAAAATCHASSCEGLSPYSTGCINGSVIEHEAWLSYSDGVGGTAEQGHVRLWYSPTCRTAWATIYGIPGASADYKDYAYVHRSDNTSEWCYVPKGQTSCWTNMVNDAGYTSYSVGSDYAYDGADGYWATFYGVTGSY